MMLPEFKKPAKEPFRRSGDPMRVQICRTGDNEAKNLIRISRSFGQTPYEFKDWICVDVYGDGTIYRAPDAVLRNVPRGTYLFKDEDIYFSGSNK